MKNIWKLFMVVMMAFAIVACQQPGTSTDDDSSSTPASSVAADSSSTAASSNAADPSSTATDPSSNGADPSSNGADPSSNGADPSSNGTDPSSNGGDDSSTPDTIPDSYIFYTDVSIDAIATNWGGSPEAPKFTVILTDTGALEGFASGAITEPQGLPEGMYCFQVKVNNNATFEILDEAGATGVYDSGAMVYYDGLAAQFDGEGSVRLYVNLEDLSMDQLIILGADIQDEKQYEAPYSKYKDTIPFNKNKLVGCTIALVPADEEENPAIGSFWNADLMSMTRCEANETFPAEVDKPELEAPLTLADIDYLIGSANQEDAWNETVSDSNFDENGAYTFTAAEAETVEFKFIVAGHGWDFQAGPSEATTATLGASIPLYYNGNAPTVSFATEADHTYKITYVYDPDDGASCVVTDITE